MKREASPTTARSGPATSLAPSVLLPLRFVLLGVVSLFVGSGFLVARPDLLSTYHYNQYVVAVTHLFVLGFLLSVVMGATYQLVPVALETRLYSERLARWQFFLHVVGLVGMVWMFWRWDMEQVGHYASVMVLGVLLFAWNVLRTLIRARQRGAVGLGVASAVCWLLLTVFAGLAIAAGKSTYESAERLSVWSPVGMLVHGLAAVAAWMRGFEALAVMHAHAHLGGVGFFVMMIVAVSYQLVPMFTLSNLQNARRAKASIWLLNGGLAALFVLLAQNSRWKLAGAVLVGAALALYGWELVAILRARVRRKLDWGLWMFLTAMLFLGVLALLGCVLCWPGLPATLFTTQLENVYGLLGLLGVVGLSILGFLHKIVPFIVWYRVYSPEVGRRKVPAMGDLFSERWQVLGFAGYAASLALMSAGALAGSATWVRIGALVLLASLLVFGGNLASMLGHLWRPRLSDHAPAAQNPPSPTTPKPIAS